MNAPAAALVGPCNEKVALREVSLEAVLDTLATEVTVRQHWHNQEAQPIEGIYTFPLPLEAVLLEFEVTLGERRLVGCVVEKQAAERRYEEVVDSGAAAVMLEQAEPGLYTMNVGNLLPDESCLITFRYALPNRWVGDSLRLMLPTTIAPRYGRSSLLPHQQPEHSFTVENRFNLRIVVTAALVEARIDCPSHLLEATLVGTERILSLSQPRAVMDRDVVLNLQAAGARDGLVQTAREPDAVVAVASIQPFFPGLQQRRPLRLAILVDCSGSMQGDSIAQAREALGQILGSLDEHDHALIVAFGSEQRICGSEATGAITRRRRRLESVPAQSGSTVPAACDARFLERARAFASHLQADLGGTELGAALEVAHEPLGREPGDVFLITDGEVGDWQPLVEQATRRRCRYFTVGVGSAVSEALVRGLAEATAGACELVSPGEGMTGRIVRHFERMRSARARRVTVRWPEGARDLAPAGLDSAFQGDTLLLTARLPSLTEGSRLALEIETEAGERHVQEVAIPLPRGDRADEAMPALARLTAALRMKQLADDEARSTALAYQLLSPYTNWLVVAERTQAEKALDTPALRRVPQTLAAGWGGTGQVMFAGAPDAAALPWTHHEAASTRRPQRPSEAVVEFDEFESSIAAVDLGAADAPAANAPTGDAPRGDAPERHAPSTGRDRPLDGPSGDAGGRLPRARAKHEAAELEGLFQEQTFMTKKGLATVAICGRQLANLALLPPTADMLRARAAAIGLPAELVEALILALLLHGPLAGHPVARPLIEHALAGVDAGRLATVAKRVIDALQQGSDDQVLAALDYTAYVAVVRPPAAAAAGDAERTAFVAALRALIAWQPETRAAADLGFP